MLEPTITAGLSFFLPEFVQLTHPQVTSASCFSYFRCLENVVDVGPSDITAESFRIQLSNPLELQPPLPDYRLHRILPVILDSICYHGPLSVTIDSICCTEHYTG